MCIEYGTIFTFYLLGGKGWSSTNGNLLRLAYLEQSVEEIQDAIEPKNMETAKEEVIKTDEEIVLPVSRVNGDDVLTDESTPDEWYSPSKEWVITYIWEWWVVPIQIRDTPTFGNGPCIRLYLRVACCRYR